MGVAIPGYENFRVIGEGGFATVYRAVQPAFRREVAVKVLDRRPTDDRVLAVFAKECQAVGLMSGHPHVVEVYETGTTAAGQPYLVMQLLPGGSLADAIVHGRPLPLARAVDRMAEVADILSEAHDLGVLHRDIKPANVMIDGRGRARLVDFGIARVVDAATTTAGVATGTVAYMAPELLSGDKASTASDIYALGLTLATVLHGRNPLVSPEADHVAGVMAQILSGDPPQAPPGTPGPVAELVSECTARRPGARPSDAGEVQRRLVAFATSSRSTSPPGVQPPTAAPPRPSGPPGPGAGRAPGHSGKGPLRFPEPPSSAWKVRPDHTLAEPPPPPPPAPAPPPRHDVDDAALPLLAGGAGPGRPAPEDVSPDSPAAKTSTPTPWRRNVLAAATAVVLLVGVGLVVARDGPDSDDRATGGTGETTSVPSPPVDLEVALLLAGDLGRGWGVDPSAQDMVVEAARGLVAPCDDVAELDVAGRLFTYELSEGPAEKARPTAFGWEPPLRRPPIKDQETGPLAYELRQVLIRFASASAASAWLDTFIDACDEGQTMEEEGDVGDTAWLDPGFGDGVTSAGAILRSGRVVAWFVQGSNLRGERPAGPVVNANTLLLRAIQRMDSVQ